ncbi:MAG: heparinase II/III family protein [Methylobacteriaceae bacterium]|nr:heparinase II/III family protein [Methylobacteriaceae bacterium]
MSLAGLVLGQSARRLRRGLSAPARLMAVWRARAPERLVIAPQDLRTADPTIADDIYGGYFVFYGKAVNTKGESPFLVASPAPAWTQALMGFAWLRHLRAAETAIARANARALVDDWIALCGRPPASDPGGRQAHEAGWDAAVTARRLMSWISQSPLILEGADRPFYRRFMKSVGRQAAWLALALQGGLTGHARLLAAVALAELTLCADGLDALRRRAQRYLAAELDAQILPDGGHIGRNPAALVDLLLDLLPLRQAYAARGQEPPQQLLNAVDRMLPMLRLLRHGDGALALFNGMGVTRPEALATLLAYDDGAGAGLAHATHSGYLRLQAEDALAIVDVGAAPPRDFSAEAHAGCLSFEFSVAGERLIGNCGAPAPNRPALREASRQTAAHSTLVVADTSSCRFAPTTALSAWLDAQIIAGPRRLEVERGADGRSMTAIHDGYVRRFGLRHRRRLALTPDALEGEDELQRVGKPRTDAPPAPWALRFHLHPAVTVAPGPDGYGVLLTPPSGAAWLFACDVAARIEESVHFAAPDGPRPCAQIVVSVDDGALRPVRWSLRRA